VPDRIEISEDLPRIVGGYRTLEYLSYCGWSFAIVRARTELFEPDEVLLDGQRDGWPPLTAQAATVQEATEKLWRDAWHTLGRAAVLPYPECMNGRAA
jgi:hypothetical protein